MRLVTGTNITQDSITLTNNTSCNCIIYPGLGTDISGPGIASGHLGYPTYTYQYIYPTETKYDIQLRKVENGWILLKNGKEYIIKNPEEIVKYMKEEKK